MTDYEAERDAAVAALERVRAIVSDPCTEGCCDFCEGKNEGWEMVLQALDGAPEPEGVWEYMARTDYGRVVAQGSLDEIGRLSGHIWERRRKAGPWLPVKGESK